MKKESKQKANTRAIVSSERKKRLKELSERLHGSLPDFMTQDDLRKMRADSKWPTAQEPKN